MICGYLDEQKMILPVCSEQKIGMVSYVFEVTKNYQLLVVCIHFAVASTELGEIPGRTRLMNPLGASVYFTPGPFRVLTGGWSCLYLQVQRSDRRPEVSAPSISSLTRRGLRFPGQHSHRTLAFPPFLSPGKAFLLECCLPGSRQEFYLSMSQPSSQHLPLLCAVPPTAVSLALLPRILPASLALYLQSNTLL